MNSMKKRIIAMLVICISILSLAACGADPKTIDYNGKSYDELEENAVSTWESIQSLDMAQLEMIVEQIDSLSEAEQIAFFDANEGASEQLALFRSWISVSKEVGDYVGVDSFSVTKSGKSTTTELILEFEKRPVVLSIVYKNRDMSVETTTVDLVYTTGEKMQRALMNTVMGMGTVFIMLIIICLIISCFSVIPKIENRLKEKNQAKKVPEISQQAPPAVTEAVVPRTDDLELIAVITAAIAAGTGQSTEDFVVRSIKRR